MPSSLKLHRQLQNAVAKVEKQLGMVALLRRANAADRTCTVVMATFSAIERMGNLVNAEDVKALIVAKGLAIPPDQNVDRLVLLDPATRVETDTYKIVGRPLPIAPGGVVLYYELQVRKN